MCHLCLAQLYFELEGRWVLQVWKDNKNLQLDATNMMLDLKLIAFFSSRARAKGFIAALGLESCEGSCPVGSRQEAELLWMQRDLQNLASSMSRINGQACNSNTS